MTKKEKDKILARIQLARKHLTHFVSLTFPKYSRTKMHDIYTGVLNRFAQGKIPKLIISMPPQHGKSEVSTRRLPPFMFGLNPDLKLAIASYSQTMARKFGRDIRRIMKDPKYRHIFPKTRLATAADPDYTNSADEAEIVDHNGSLILAGRGAGLTGVPLDALIIDDLYKNAEESNSPIIRDNVIEWYKSVADTRLHNDSQQLIVFTRWDLEDLVGWLEKQGLVDELISMDQLENPDPDRWLKINFPALKTRKPTRFDPREEGTALWEARHSQHRLEAKREQDEELFEKLYQGNPQPSKGMLYSKGFKEYKNLPETIVDRWAYVDTADEGKDYLCSIASCSDNKNNIYITDIIYTQDGAEVTELQVVSQLIAENTDTAYIESNSGGRSFARNVQRMLRESRGRTSVEWFHQSKNKEARILTNAANVMQQIYFPVNWRNKWPEFYNDVMTFKKVFRSNKHDDAPDTLTGVVEKFETWEMSVPDEPLW